MDFFDLKNISERYMELINPVVPEKILKIGQILGLDERSRVIDFGCGYAEVQAMWAESYGISGVGIEIREHVCVRARKKLKQRGLAERIEIVCGKGADYRFEEATYDAAVCIGATFAFGGYRETIRAMKKAVKPEGKLAIGEAYWRKMDIPAEARDAIGGEFMFEPELMKINREEGFDLEYVVRASVDDWDRYEADNWYGFVRWLEENPDHPERMEVVKQLHSEQDEYASYGREFMGWAIYVLSPSRY